MSKRKRRVVVGDVFELRVQAGFAYVQTIGEHPRNKSFWAVRVIEGVHAHQSDDVAKIALDKTMYSVILGDVAYSEKVGDLRFVGHAEVSEDLRNWIPILRGNAVHPSNADRQENWWLDDGLKSRKIGRLSEEQRKLTDTLIVPSTSLSRHIDQGWDPNWEFKGEGAVEFLRPEQVNPQTERWATFFLVFTDAKNVKAVEAAIVSQNPMYETAIDELDGEQDDSEASYVLVIRVPIEDCNDVEEMLAFDARFEELAAKFGGLYDGNEIPV